MKRKRQGMFYCEARCARCRATSTCAWLCYSWVCQWCASMPVPHVEEALWTADCGPWRLLLVIRVDRKTETKSWWAS